MTLKSNLKKTTTICLMTLCLSATLSTASAKGKGGHRGKPPEAAFTACAEQTEAGAACSFAKPNGDTVEGTCKAPRQSEETLVCAPEGGKRSKNGKKKG
ncbi:hypothetical protein [Marinicella litoralis]|uniref:Uncharacterized protein n=1 Tax=Marinicella litoralis TaxID=644220 RepID=A0A4V3DGK1_9GAMM|nr:hypothetical protein [Marinicella litoralis]TDR14661.1 hypothetical protein C8D91_2932 [Marinicella litoralis]